MPLYVEKSVRAGLFRFDASEAGAGFSVDAQLGGLGLPPRFHVIRSEQGGFRYKGAVAPSKRVEHGAIVPSQPKVTLSSNVEMIEVESDDVLQMRDEKFASILDDINTQVRAVRWASILPTVMSIVALVAALVVNPACLKLIVLALPLLLVGKWIDAGRRVTVLLYELDERTMRAFTRVTEAFDLMMSCSGAWHIEAGGAVRDLTTWKQNAGASHLVQKSSTSLTYSLPGVVRSNITPPALSVGRQVIYFLPDVALIQDGQKFGAVAYPDLRLSWQASNSIEPGPVPDDTHIMDYVWEHPNKNGGPDRRYSSPASRLLLRGAAYQQRERGERTCRVFLRRGRASVRQRGCIAA